MNEKLEIVRKQKRQAQYAREDQDRLLQQEKENAEIQAKRNALEEDAVFRVKEEEIRLAMDAKKVVDFEKCLTEIEGIKPSELRPEVKEDIAPSRSGISDHAPFVVTSPKPEEVNMIRQIDLLAEIAERSHLPKSEPKMFDGSDPTVYKAFVQSFDQLIANKTRSEADKLHYLEKYTRALPQRLVQSCFNLNSELGYREARELLNQKYGNEFVIANAFLRKLSNWPPIKNDDRDALEEFNVFLLSCRNFMKDGNALVQLNGPSQIQELVLKLPYHLRLAWRNQAFSLLEQGRPVTFLDLSAFVSQQSRLMSLPIFGEVVDKPQGKDRKAVLGSSEMKKSVSMATDVREDNLKGDQLCLACKKANHSLETCFFFAKRSDEEKSKFIQERELCFGCLTVGHIGRNCKKRLQCKKCQKRHPTCLHKSDSPKEYGWFRGSKSVELKDLESTSACCLEEPGHYARAGQPNRVAMALIPVKVRVQGGLKEIITYAGLDNFSSDCFVTDEIVEKLGLVGPRTKISLTTMNETRRAISTRAINGLEVSDIDGNEKVFLPVSFSKDKLPVSKRDVITPEECGRYPHLSDIPFVFIDANVGLLLGANSPEALKPLEIVSGPVGTPYASKHKLGWALNGPIGTRRMSGRQVKVNSVQADYQGIDKELRQMYSNDFRDIGEDELGPSAEDKVWLKKVENSIHKEGGHYCISLPFRHDRMNFADNRSQALRQLHGLKKRIFRDAKFHTDYAEFMSMMIANDFAEEA
ncbi:uncharacterized protein LOC131888586 [Tigriopus californicus]|uniref:uncharacterized protein LOC131888586 n=1 Tax=Tigriopus californicus TaxID=6832 RepID=UPI0027DA4B16|nr:uncharacterized protein LOC131888586 [Tigriopus californicus]